MWAQLERRQTDQRNTSAASESLAPLGQHKSYPRRERRLDDARNREVDCIVGLLSGVAYDLENTRPRNVDDLARADRDPGILVEDTGR